MTKQFANGIQAQEVVLIDTSGNEVSPAAGGALPAGTNQIGKVVIKEAYAVVGAHASGTDISSAVVLTKPAGATAIIIQALTKNIRFRLDGVNPTAAAGFQIQADTSPLFLAVPGADVRVIQEAATASMHYFL